MTNKLQYKSDAFEAIHSSASGMYRSGVIDKATMRKFDAACLVAPAELGPEQIKKLRVREQATAKATAGPSTAALTVRL